MAYIGTQPLAGQYRKLDDISSGFNGATTSFTTSVGGTNVTAGSPQQLLVSLGGVIQQPTTDYTVNTSTIIFTTAPASGLSFFAILMGDALNTSVPADGSITSAKLAGSLSVGLGAGSVSTPSLFFSGDTNTGIWSPAADTVAASTGGSERLRIDSSGRVGIGTTSPSRLLHLSAADSTSFSSADFDQTYNFLRIVNTTNDKAAGIYFGIGTNGEAAITAAETTDGETALVFGTRGGGARSERARLDHAGRLLVGTSTAETDTVAGLLQVQATNSSATFLIKRNSANATAPYIYLAKSRGANNSTTIVQSGDSLGEVRFAGADGSTEVGSLAALIKAEVDGTPGTNDMPGRLVFSTTADGASSPTERMRISNNGQTVIYGSNTANSIASLYVSALFPATPVYIQQNTTNTHYAIEFRNANGLVGSVTTSGSSTSFLTSSDYRLKENVVSLTGAIDRINDLQVRRFNFKADPDYTVDGFIAHEVQAVVPEAITGEKDAVDDDGNPIYQGIDQSKLVPLLTAALQEAIGRIEQVETEKAEQQTVLDDLLARVAALEAA